MNPWCWWQQWRLSLAEDERVAAPAGARRHAQRCPRCRQFAGALMVLRAELGGGVEPGVLVRRGGAGRWVATIGLATAAAVALAGLLVWGPSAPVLEPPVATNRVAAGDLPDPGRWLHQLVAQAGAALDAPVQDAAQELLTGAEASARLLVAWVPALPDAARNRDADTLRLRHDAFGGSDPG